MKDTNPLRILIVDDHAIVREGVRQILSSAFQADFREAGDARVALEVARRNPLDLILLDVTMPGRSGLDILGELQAAQPNTPILVLSTHGEDQFARRVLRAGGSGYITKASVPNELIRAARKVLTGGRYVSESLAEQLAGVLQRGNSPSGAAHESLSAREFEVLRMIALGKSGKEIAAELCVSFKTISTYRTRLLQKLDLRTNAELVQYALREGLIEGRGGL